MISCGPLKVMSTKCGVKDPEIQVLMFDIEALICNLLTEENPLLAGNCSVYFAVYSFVVIGELVFRCCCLISHSALVFSKTFYPLGDLVSPWHSDNRMICEPV